ncbi:DISARM system phospholipase D-like protein DrmC [Actinospica sp. MGRD01-02]|uniref:DISARM system phospholipase D-like protein DrmC n=1 Tax=Actinospica acidithermotolerans TaxID=2828514 RepID=A0A941E3W0_9ACTN|nr:DISARM system phospholipase D-like protein DrmC [Actinospica acidithermotolerans]MBR7824676.1 DISARM system phospholipase D-like protein DrmC [Actinospica acidithermotolerans]
MSGEPYGSDRLPEVLAKVATSLGPAHVRAWAQVLEPLVRPDSGLVASLVRARPGDPRLGPLAGQLAAAWRATEPQPHGAALALSLRTAMSQYESWKADHALEWVISGPSDRTEPVRHTAAVASSIIARAEHSILLATYAANDIADIATDLTAAATRGVRIDAIAETRGTEAAARLSRIPGMNVWHWPEHLRPVGAAMHAKFIAVDDSWLLLGSANLTGRAMGSNLEVGAVIHAPADVQRLTRHFAMLMSPARGTLVQYQP